MVFNSTGYSRSRRLPGGRLKKKVKMSRKKNGNIKSSSYNNSYSKMVDNQLHVYRYPFSTKTKYPRIPDGLIQQSIGLPFNSSFQVPVLPDRRYFFVLYPGITTCGAFVSADMLGALDHGSFKFVKFIQHCLPHRTEEVLPVFAAGGFDINNEVPARKMTILDYGDIGYDKYRYVSCGARLGVDSGPYTNSGNFRAVRFDLNKVCQHFYLNKSRTSLFNTVVPHLFHNFTDLFFTRNPSYVTGSIKEMGNYEFRLKDNVHEHNFIQIPNIVEAQNDRYFNHYLQHLHTDGHELTDQFSYILDHQFDVILIEFRSVVKTDVTIHVQANVEMNCSVEGSFNHFEMDTVSNKAKLSATRREIEKTSRLAGTLHKSLFTKS